MIKKLIFTCYKHDIVTANDAKSNATSYDTEPTADAVADAATAAASAE